MSVNMNDDNLFIKRSLLRWILLGIGLVALIVMAVALIVTPQNRFNTVSYVALGVGLLGLAGFVLVDTQSLIQALTGRSGQYGITTALLSLFFVAFIVALFVVIRSADIAPIDVTEGQRYSLSSESIRLLGELEEPVHAIAFYYDDSLQREEADTWLQQYKRASNGMLTYEFVDPDRNPARAAQYELTRTGVIVFEQGDRTATAGTLSESDLTGALVRVLLGERRVLYAVVGHGERDIDGLTGQGLSQAKRSLTNANFTVQTLNLLQAGSVPEDADVVLIAGPTSQFSAAEVEALQAFLDAGGSLFLLSDPGTGGGALGNGVLGVSFSPDGTRIATAGADGTARVWDVRSGDELLVLRGHTSDVVDVVFAPDGRTIATAARDSTIRIWDAQSGSELAQLPGVSSLVRRIAFSPDGSLIASAGEDQTLMVWDTRSAEMLSYSPIAVPAPLLAVTFSPDGSLIAAGGGRSGGSGPIYIWNAASGALVLEKPLHQNIVLGLAFTPDGQTLHSVSVDGTEGTLDIASGDGSTTPRYPETGISSIAIGPDGTTAFALLDGTVHLRAPGTAAPAADTVLEGQTDILWSVTFSPDGALLASASRDGSARLWQAASGELVQDIRGHTTVDPLLTYLETSWAIRVRDDLVIDLLTASEFDELTPVVFNYDQFSPITAPLAQSQRRTFLTLARSIEIVMLPGSPIIQTPLMFSSSGSGGQITSWGETTNPFATGVLNFDETDIPGPVVLAVSAENTLSGARLVVIGDADFASNDALRFTGYGNQELFVNAANWLAEGETSIQLPPPNFDQRRMERPFGPVGIGLVIISTTCLLPLLVLVGGLIAWVARRRRR